MNSESNSKLFEEIFSEEIISNERFRSKLLLAKSFVNYYPRNQNLVSIHLHGMARIIKTNRLQAVFSSMRLKQKRRLDPICLLYFIKDSLLSFYIYNILHAPSTNERAGMSKGILALSIFIGWICSKKLLSRQTILP